MKIKLGRKGEINVMPLVVGVIFLTFMLPVIYLGIKPVYTTSSVANETVTMAASPVPVNLAHKDVVDGSEMVYNATDASISVGEGEGSAADCGGGTTCYYNFTDGNKWTYGTLAVNLTGDFNVSYTYYPESYSHQTADRAVILFVTTLLILGVLVIIAKAGGLI